MDLAVRPGGLQLDASLGNITAEYGALPAGHPNRTLLTVRQPPGAVAAGSEAGGGGGGGGSDAALLQVTFR